MFNRSWKQPKKKYDSTARKSKRNIDKQDDIKAAQKDHEKLKKHKKRLNLNWFFHPEDE